VRRALTPVEVLRTLSHCEDDCGRSVFDPPEPQARSRVSYLACAKSNGQIGTRAREQHCSEVLAHARALNSRRLWAQIAWQ
jgi:hypothetical protein